MYIHINTMDYQWLQNTFTAVTSFIKDHVDYNKIYSDWNSAETDFHNDIYMTMMLYRTIEVTFLVKHLLYVFKV